MNRTQIQDVKRTYNEQKERITVLSSLAVYGLLSSMGLNHLS